MREKFNVDSFLKSLIDQTTQQPLTGEALNSALAGLQNKIESTLQSILFMMEVLAARKNEEEKASFNQVCILKMMQEMVVETIHTFCLLFDVVPEHLGANRQFFSIFSIQDKVSKQDLTTYLLDNLYQLQALNHLAVNDMLDDFDDIHGNMLLASMKQSALLVKMMEALCHYSFKA